MARTTGGLGRGLDALLKGNDEHRSQKDIIQLSVSAVQPNPYQPRKVFDDNALDELTASIKKQGVLQPILVRPAQADSEAKYELVAGERRWRASIKAGLATIPALVRNLSDDDSLLIALVENIQRENLNAMEEAYAFQMIKEKTKCSQEELAANVNKSRSAVANTLRLLQLPDAIKEDLRNDKITPGHARCLLAISDTDAQIQLKDKILNDFLSVRETEGLVAHWKEHGTFPTDADQGVREPRAINKVQVDPHVQHLEEQLRDSGYNKARIKGNRDKGTLSLPYTSEDELNTLLNTLTLNTNNDH